MYAAIEPASAAAELHIRRRSGDREELHQVGRASANTLREAFKTAAVTNIVTPTAESVSDLVRT